MTIEKYTKPDNTAIRVALWRALHVQIDSLPHVLDDEIGLQLATPEANWKTRPDMDPERTKPFRASIVARARFIEDLVATESENGVTQYVILGAGLDTFVQRKPEFGTRLTVFEIDQLGTQEWKRSRLVDLGMEPPGWLQFVPVDFEKENWLERLQISGFDINEPAVIASTGVSMYITKEATARTFEQISTFAPGSTFAMSFIVPIDLVDSDLRIGVEMAEKGARASGTPWISFYQPDEILQLALHSGFKEANHVSSAELGGRYFTGRMDGLCPPQRAEELLVARISK